MPSSSPSPAMCPSCGRARCVCEPIFYCNWCDEEVSFYDAIQGEDRKFYCCEKHAGKVLHDA